MVYHMGFVQVIVEKNIVQIFGRLPRACTRHGMRQIKQALACVLLLGGMGVAHAEKASVPSSGQGCTAGWDQLLSAEERVQTAPNRDCQASTGHAQEAAKPGDARTIAAFVRGPQAPLTIVKMEPLRPGGKRAPVRAAKRQVAAPQISSGAMPIVLAPMIDYVARIHDIDPLLLHAIARVESRHQPEAVSPAGAHGLMQVILPTARNFGVNNERALHDPLTNLHVSASYLKRVQLRFGNDLPLVLAAYNAGEGAVERYGRRVPPYRETQDYVRKVLAEYGLLLQVRGRLSAATALARVHS